MIAPALSLARAVRVAGRPARRNADVKADTISQRPAAILSSRKARAIAAFALMLLAPAAPQGQELDEVLADLDTLPGAIVLAAADAPWTELAPGAMQLDLRLEYAEHTHRLHAFTFDPARWRMRVAPAPEPGGFYVDRALGKKDGLAINGGYFDYRDTPAGRALVPTGLVVAGGDRLADYRGGSGVLFDTGRTVGIAWAKNRKLWSGAPEALQVGPLLVDPGGKPGIRKPDGPRARRSAVCLTAEGEVAVVMMASAISLYDFARVLADMSPGGFACERAINLDGGPSSQVYGRFEGAVVDVPGMSRVVNAVVFEPR
ncbi:MAG: phosphodiester glycosidase family protein [Hyphomicrobiales bacterium]